MTGFVFIRIHTNWICLQLQVKANLLCIKQVLLFAFLTKTIEFLVQSYRSWPKTLLQWVILTWRKYNIQNDGYGYLEQALSGSSYIWTILPKVCVTVRESSATPHIYYLTISEVKHIYVGQYDILAYIVPKYGNLSRFFIAVQTAKYLLKSCNLGRFAIAKTALHYILCFVYSLQLT